MRFRPFVTGCILGLTSFVCLATTIVRLSLEEAVGRADWVVSGDVVRNWCSWDSGHRFIWTHTEIAVHQQWKGVAGGTITISEPGGEVDGVRLAVAGMVRYTPGEHVVALLYRTPIGFIRTVGLSQGKLVVDGRGVVHPSAPSAMLASAQGVRPSGTNVADLEGSSVEAVHARIAGIIKGARK